MKTYHVKVRKHRTARSIVLAWWRWNHPRLNIDKFLDSKMELSISNGIGKEFKEATARDFIKHVKDLKIWAFCEHKCDCSSLIHVWHAKDVEYGPLLEVITHELEHATGTQSEKRACKSGGLAHYASILIRDDLKIAK